MGTPAAPPPLAILDPKNSMLGAKPMKRILAGGAIATLTAFCVLSKQVPAQTARPVASPEAQAAAKSLWDNLLTRCDDPDHRTSYFYDGRNDKSEIWGDLAEFRDVHFYVFPIEVSRADQLNGTRWRADAVMIADVFRSASLRPEGRGKDAWGSFQDGEALGDVRYGAKYMTDGEPLVTSKNGTIAFIGSPDALHPQPKGWFVVGMEQRGGNLFYKWAWSDERRSEEISHLRPSCSIFPGTREFQAEQSPKQDLGSPPRSAAPTASGRPSGTKTIRVDSAVQAAMLTRKVAPIYPPLAAAAHVQGAVKFEVTINTEGRVQNVQLLSGPPLLVQAATNAVRQWEYRPTLLNGIPASVSTIVDVDFTPTP